MERARSGVWRKTEGNFVCHYCGEQGRDSRSRMDSGNAVFLERERFEECQERERGGGGVV